MTEEIEKLLSIVDLERARQGFSGVGLSEAAGLGMATYLKWVDGKTGPSLKMLLAVLHVLGLELRIVRRKKAE